MIVVETCPKCGHDLRNEVICTYPPIPRKVCWNCGWSWEGKQEKIVRVPFGGNTNKKCDNKTPERGKRIKCHPIDDVSISKTCQSESDHEWEVIGLLTVGADCMCRKCCARKTVPWEEILG